MRRFDTSKNFTFEISQRTAVIILKAVQHLQDAQYDHHAEVIIGERSSTFVLVDEDEFLKCQATKVERKELVDFLDEERGWEEFPHDFERIVKTPHCDGDASLSLFEESEGS